MPAQEKFAEAVIESIVNYDRKYEFCGTLVFDFSTDDEKRILAKLSGNEPPSFRPARFLPPPINAQKTQSSVDAWPVRTGKQNGDCKRWATFRR